MPLNNRAALLLVLSVMLACPLLMCCSGQPLKRDFDFKSVVSSIDAERVRKHILFFASLKSRFTGYPGCNEAAEYIRRFFEDLGLNVTLQRFSVVVPVDHGASLRVLPEGRSFRIYPLWPNMVSPPTINGSIV
ncbi:MAG: hypothetical protein DRK00_04680, partial [Thermoprotei archaeon]